MRSPSDVNVSKPSTNDANAFDIWLLGRLSLVDSISPSSLYIF